MVIITKWSEIYKYSLVIFNELFQSTFSLICIVPILIAVVVVYTLKNVVWNMIDFIDPFWWYRRVTIKIS